METSESPFGPVMRAKVEYLVAMFGAWELWHVASSDSGDWRSVNYAQFRVSERQLNRGVPTLSLAPPKIMLDRSSRRNMIENGVRVHFS